MYDMIWQEKVKRSFPLTSVEKVEYDEVNDPTTFVIAFSDCIEVLHAETAEEASDWVDKITEGISSCDHYACIAHNNNYKQQL